MDDKQVNENFICQCCHVVFENFQKLSYHISYHTNYKSFFCLFCCKIHKRKKPYDRDSCQRSKRYVNCNSNSENNELTTYHRVTHVTQDCTIDDLDLDNLNSKEVKVLKEMIEQLEYYEQKMQ